MKKGIIIRAFSPSGDFLGDTSFLASLDDYRRMFDLAKGRGFAGVQLYTEIDTGFLSLKTPDSTLQAIRQAAADAGLAIPSLEIAPLQYSVTSDDAAERQRGREVIGRGLEMAHHLGAEGVLVIPGYVGLPWEKGGGTPVHYEAAYDRTRAALADLAPAAERLGVDLCLENIWNMFLLSPLEMRRLIDEVNSPRVGVLFDTGNIVAFGFPEQWIRILGRRIRQIHLKDFRRAVGTVEGFVPLLAGDVNWPAVMSALREVGYDGFLIPEIFPYETLGPTMLDHVSLTLDRLMEA